MTPPDALRARPQRRPREGTAALVARVLSAPLARLPERVVQSPPEGRA